MALVSTTFNGVLGVDFNLLQKDPSIVYAKTEQFSIDTSRDDVIIRRLKFKVGTTIKGIATKLPNGSTNVKLPWISCII